MRQAIQTTYKGPTDSNGSRIIAKAQAGRTTIPWDHALDVAQNHARAALAYARKHEWMREGTELHGGALPDGSYAFVIVDTIGTSTDAAEIASANGERDRT